MFRLGTLKRKRTSPEPEVPIQSPPRRVVERVKKPCSLQTKLSNYNRASLVNTADVENDDGHHGKRRRRDAPVPDVAPLPLPPPSPLAPQYAQTSLNVPQPIDPAPTHISSPEESANALANMKWYHKPASPANGHHETIIILGADGELDTPIYAGSGVSRVLDFLLRQYNLGMEMVPTPDTSSANSISNASLATPDLTDSHSSAEEPKSPHPFDDASEDVSVYSPSNALELVNIPQLPLPALATVAENEDLPSIGTADLAEVAGAMKTHAGLGLKHPAMTHESIFVVGLMLLLLFITAKASSDISTKAHMVDAVEDSFSVPPRNSIEGVDFSRLARHAGRPSSHAVVRFNGSFSTGDGFIKARLEISAHPRRPSVWWLVATASDDSRVLANLTFGAGANMTYEPNGLVEIETTDPCVHKSTMAAPICFPPSSDLHPSPTSHFHLPLPLPPDFLLLPYLPEETSNIAPEVKMPNPAPADDMEVTLTHVTPLPINPSCDV
ncbi:hypothetical protein FRB95_013931 [Tulasnella sp. JGI-2019a]|nr:hypothetical protein FRB95_013931 [Tulasnella sp. JGI-2019a]